MRPVWLVLFVFLIGCVESAHGEEHPHVVDIEKVLIQSNAAHLGREHIKKVQTVLENSYNEIVKELANIPEEQRQKEIQEAAGALTQQLELEKAAVTRVVNNLMLEAIRSYRIDKGIASIFPRQFVLDIDNKYDITDQIINFMNTKKPVFGALPVVQVNKQPTAKPKK